MDWQRLNPSRKEASLPGGRKHRTALTTLGDLKTGGLQAIIPAFPFEYASDLRLRQYLRRVHQVVLAFERPRSFSVSWPTVNNEALAVNGFPLG
jgi:hypothetical protein